ncbi:unnamed protein product [Ectocarpus sp. 12 AP-2014]
MCCCAVDVYCGISFEGVVQTHCGSAFFSHKHPCWNVLFGLQNKPNIVHCTKLSTRLQRMVDRRRTEALLLVCTPPTTYGVDTCSSCTERTYEQRSCNSSGWPHVCHVWHQ